MKRFAALLLFAFTCLCFSGTALHAQSNLGAHIGYNTKAEATLVGIDGWFSLGSIGDLGVMVNPALNLYPFIDNVTYLTVDANVVLDLVQSTNTVVPFAGLGGSFIYTSTEAGGNSSDFGLNITGGVLLHVVGIQPFAQGTFTISEGTSFIIQAGVAFPI
jgi:hypothetical protein